MRGLMRARAGGALALALAALLAAALAADVDKRAESELLLSQMAPAPSFLMSSRYGRSPQRMIAPRNDKFLMSSRYGKRAELEGEPLPPAPALRGGGALAGGAGGAGGPLDCQYTGVAALYRCRPASPLQDRRLMRDSSSEED